MKFFKHFTDAHRGKSLQIIEQKYGLLGTGRYWRLVELCAEKMEKTRDEEFTAAHCIFEFEKTYLMKSLGYANRMHTRRYLDALTVLGLCSVSETRMLYVCSMPKLLESLDRDTKRTRPARVRAAPRERERTYMSTYTKKERENKKDILPPSFSAEAVGAEEEIIGGDYGHEGSGEKPASWFAEKYCHFVPSATQGNYDFIFKQQIKTAADKENLSAAIENYTDFIRDRSQRERPKKASLASFLTVRPDNPWTWKDFIKSASAGLAVPGGGR